MEKLGSHVMIKLMVLLIHVDGESDGSLRSDRIECRYEFRSPVSGMSTGR